MAHGCHFRRTAARSHRNEPSRRRWCECGNLDDEFSERSAVGASLNGVLPIDGRACETAVSTIPRR